MSDCKQTQVIKTCDSIHDHCEKARLIINKPGSDNMYIKGCTNGQECDASGEHDELKDCKEADLAGYKTDCKLDCCHGDLCNGSKVPVVSVIVLVTCALVAFVG
ncbi:hypothetical protein OS493_003294 [Desmophyllum pertusum]|uniref:Uncharacterized protein n=1 Tax=Desmophyllum pertusum TaxID=174260 RepID=A0A9X0A5U4_9CNID|nr:hypothetical protein OS493_003294 [Desmophyllum pertusum]